MKDGPTDEHAGMKKVGPKPTVQILLATRDNADFLVPLLESLLKQTEQDFQLLVSDDCSTDDTVKILWSYAERFRNPVWITQNDRPSGSAMANFAGLMRKSRADFVFLCDADDVWHEDKLELFLKRAVQTQNEIGPGVPLFLFSDANIIGAQGEQLNESYWAFKNTDPQRCLNLERLLVCTPMIGCATLMNRALVELARDVPVGQATGHDWWALLVAGCFGKVDFLPEKTISYRIHGKNSSKPLKITIAPTTRLLRLGWEVRRRMAIRQRQAAPLLDQFADKMPPEKRAIIQRFLSLPAQSSLKRRVSILRYDYIYPDWLRTAALLVFV